MIKQCGSCKFWDKEGGMIMLGLELNPCSYDLYPACFSARDKEAMRYYDGQDCPVYKENS